MAQPKLAAGKKRYSVSLTQARVEKFQSLCREFGMPPSTMSNAFDDLLRDLSQMFQEAKERGTMNIEDIFRLMGRQIHLIMEEEARDADARKNSR